MENKERIKELAILFLRLGTTTFGGPAAHIAMMQKEVVVKKKWMTDAHFLDLIGATNLIPGPNSTEMAIHIGYERAGWKGLMVAGICFILPAVIITGIFAWFYKEYGELPQVKPFIYGIKPAIIAVILSAVFPLAKKSLKSTELAIGGFGVLILCLMGYNEIIVMFGAGLLGWLIHLMRTNKSSLFLLAPTLIPKEFIATIHISNLHLFFIFLKIGSILYGSGYVLFAILDSELVSQGLLSRQYLIDAIAVGQVTPGPVFSSVTFIGFLMNGIPGAILATMGVFIPSFLFVALLNPYIPRMRNSKSFSVFLDWINMASVAVIVVACLQMAKESVYDWRTIVVAIGSLGILFGIKNINSTWVVLSGSIVGYFLFLI
jgi:chromate transporter